MKSSYRPCFQGSLRVAGSSRFRYSSESVRRRAFHPVAVLACREIYFLRFVEIKIKKISDYQRITFLFFSNKKASFSTKEA
ncbi:MAG: hypothetical protein BHW66_09520 [Akkermansia sp. 54_46]|nr:MAG: hypothetical protein BHW66_09520 [Akkermansia sp. 54_46]